MGGPFWSQPIHDQAWVKGILAILEVRKALPAFPFSLTHADHLTHVLVHRCAS